MSAGAVIWWLPLTFDPTAGLALLTVKWSLLSSVKISQDSFAQLGDSVAITQGGIAVFQSSLRNVRDPWGCQNKEKLCKESCEKVVFKQIKRNCFKSVGKNYLIRGWATKEGVGTNGSSEFPTFFEKILIAPISNFIESPIRQDYFCEF